MVRLIKRNNSSSNSNSNNSNNRPRHRFCSKTAWTALTQAPGRCRASGPAP